MKHRDRVLTALGHEAPDRCPLQVSFTPEFAERLRKHLRLDDSKSHNPHGGGNTYQLERALDEDMLITSVCWANSYYQPQKRYTDEWGVGWDSVEYDTRFGKGRYTEICSHPLADTAVLDSYRAPDPTRPSLYEDARQMVAAYKTEYWINGAVPTTIFETAWALRGLPQLLMDFMEDPDLADRILDIPLGYHREAAVRLAKLGVDMIWFGDDVGTQSGMLMSPDTWRRFLKPRLADIIQAVKGVNPRVKVAYHSDGTIWPIIPELIDIGVDILNPVQPACMDPAEIKKRFGKNLCFWGTIDEQHTLPFGTSVDVRKEVLLRLKTIGKSGGLIIGPTHHVQLDTPVENLEELVRTVKSTPYGTL